VPPLDLAAEAAPPAAALDSPSLSAAAIELPSPSSAAFAASFSPQKPAAAAPASAAAKPASPMELEPADFAGPAVSALATAAAVSAALSAAVSSESGEAGDADLDFGASLAGPSAGAAGAGCGQCLTLEEQITGLRNELINGQEDAKELERKYKSIQEEGTRLYEVRLVAWRRVFASLRGVRHMLLLSAVAEPHMSLNPFRFTDVSDQVHPPQGGYDAQRRARGSRARPGESSTIVNPLAPATRAFKSHSPCHLLPLKI
jgi:hypothetical protein